MTTRGGAVALLFLFAIAEPSQRRTIVIVIVFHHHHQATRWVKHRQNSMPQRRRCPRSYESRSALGLVRRA